MPHLSDAAAPLRQALLDIGRAALGRLRPGDALQIRDERDRLIRWLGGEVAPESDNRDRIVAAVAAYRATRHFSSLHQARFACYGCTQVLDATAYRLIEDRPLFEHLLGYLAQQRQRARLFRKCYRGLLGAYFAYAPASADGRANSESLRQFLDSHRELPPVPGLPPPWVAALTAHAPLLAADPGAAYGFDKLQGNWTPLDDMRERLNLGSDSWLMRRLVLAQVDAVAALDDAGFARYTESILLLLHQHPLHAATGLGRLLDRQSRCAGAQLNAALGEQALALWGNPWLASTAHLWQCGAAAKEMAARWLQHRLLHKFFATFAAETVANRRRAAFWDLYGDDLVGMYFALGKNAFLPGNRSFLKFRRDAKGLVVRLENAAPDLHVLILQFRHHHVVELNSASEPAYFYATQHGTPPFYLAKGWIDVGALSVHKVVEGKAVAPRAKTLPHKDAGRLAWEGKFARELGMTDNALHALCRRHRCRLEESAAAPGERCIRPEKPYPFDDEVAAILAGWGYGWSLADKTYRRSASRAAPGL